MSKINTRNYSKNLIAQMTDNEQILMFGADNTPMIMSPIKAFSWYDLQMLTHGFSGNYSTYPAFVNGLDADKKQYSALNISTYPLSIFGTSYGSIPAVNPQNMYLQGLSDLSKKKNQRLFRPLTICDVVAIYYDHYRKTGSALNKNFGEGLIATDKLTNEGISEHNIGDSIYGCTINQFGWVPVQGVRITNRRIQVCIYELANNLDLWNAPVDSGYWSYIDGQTGYVINASTQGYDLTDAVVFSDEPAGTHKYQITSIFQQVGSLQIHAGAIRELQQNLLYPSPLNPILSSCILRNDVGTYYPCFKIGSSNGFALNNDENWISDNYVAAYISAFNPDDVVML